VTERDIKIVVAEGPSGRKGLLRFVLESEGYHVVGEASSAADLGRALETHHPDVVVMDDGIGATAVGMTHDLAPAAKVILVWPEAVVPIGGDAAVEPSSVLRRLGPTVERLTGVPSATGQMGAHRGGDAAAALGLGAILAMGRAAGPTGATPADLPAAIGSDPAEPIIDARGESPVLILPESPDVVPAAAEVAIAGPLTFAELEAAEDHTPAPVPGVGAVAAVATAGAAAAITSGAGATDTTPGAALNRRLGTMALGGAALAGSLVLALALSGSRVPAQGVRGEGPGVQSPSAVVASPVIPPPRAVAVPGALLGDLGGSDTTLTFVTTSAVPGAGPREGAGVGSGGTGGSGGGGGPTPPIVDTGGSGGGSGSAGSGGGGGGSGGSGGSGTGGSGGGTGGGSSFGGGGDGGKGGGGECVPGDGGDASPPCGTDDDGLDEHGHGDHGGGDHHGDGGDPADDGHGHDGDHHGSDDHGDHGHGSDHHGDDHGDHGHGSDHHGDDHGDHGHGSDHHGDDHGDHGHGDHHGGDHGGYGH
jgi:hypothetical protein